MYHLSRSGLGLLVARRKTRRMRVLPQQLRRPVNITDIINARFREACEAANALNIGPPEPEDGRSLLQ